MLNVSQRFKELMKAPVKVVRARIEVEDGTVISAEDNLVSITLESQGQYFLSAARTGKATLLGTSWSSLQGKRLTIYLTAYANAEEQDGEEACYGVYTVRLVEANLEKDMTNIEFDGSITRATNVMYNTAVLVFPMTVAQLAEAVATQGNLNLITDMTTLPNYDYTITEDLWKTINNASFRDVIDQIAGATATIARVGGADNNLEFIPVNQEPVDNLSYENLKKFKLGDEYGKVSSIVLARTPQEDNVVVVDDATTHEPGGKNILRTSTARAENHGITTVVADDGTITVSGTLEGTWADITNISSIEMKAGVEYTCSVNMVSGERPLQVVFRTNAPRFDFTINNDANSLTRTLDTDKTTIYIYLAGTDGTECNFSFRPMVEKGRRATPYEPFVENGVVEVKLANNEILDDNRENMALPILNASKGLGYRSVELDTEGHGWYEIGDKINLYEATENILPEEYQAVEYIENGGGQYIDTGVKACMNDIRCVCEMSAMNDADSAFFGSRGTYYLFYNFAQNYFWPISRANTIQGTLVVGNKYLVDWNKGVFTVTGEDGVYQNATRSNSTQDEQNMYIFNFNPKDGRQALARVYWFKIYVNDELVRDYIPCYRKSDDKVGFYDLVNEQFYPSAGNGNFIKGYDVSFKKYLDYIGTTAITYQKLEIAGSFRETLKCTLPEETDTDYATAGSIYGSIWNTEIKVDKQGNEITSIVSRQDQFENETRENFTQVVQNIDSVVTTIQTTGGGNAIHNSVGYNKETDGTLVGWTSTGTVASETSPESLANGALSGNQIDLGVSSSITQRIAVDSSGSVYTLSFRAKKSVVGQAVVHLRNSLDDYTVVLPNGTGYLWEQFEIVGVRPSESYFDVVVETNNATEYFAITDLMLTVGDSITPWVQATDEILSRNVALDSNGVKVSSNTSNDYVKLDELGLNGYSDAEGTMENVFTINRDMTEVSKLRARKQIEMPPLKVIPVNTSGNSGWAFVKIGEQ